MRVKGLTVAVAQRPAAFAEDCHRASILVAPIASPKSCSAPKAVVDFFAARREGTHALYVEDDGRIRVETVAHARGAPVVGAEGGAGRTENGKSARTARRRDRAG
jgi:competence protein ComEC